MPSTKPIPFSEAIAARFGTKTWGGVDPVNVPMFNFDYLIDKD